MTTLSTRAIYVVAAGLVLWAKILVFVQQQPSLGTVTTDDTARLEVALVHFDGFSATVRGRRTPGFTRSEMHIADGLCLGLPSLSTCSAAARETDTMARWKDSSPSATLARRAMSIQVSE